MDGNKNSPAPDQSSTPSAPATSYPQTGQSVYNPPSLVEPSAILQPPVQRSIPDVSNDPVPALAAVPPQPSGGFYNNGGLDEPDTPEYDEPTHRPARASSEPIRWTSSGDALQGHSAGWRLRMTLASIVLAGVVYFITRDLFPSISVAVAGILFGFLGARKPHPLNYQLDERGIRIGNRQYLYSAFRAFSIIEESNSVALVPLQRFAPLMYVHVDVADGRQVIDMLSAHLPMEAHKRDAVDSLAHRFKF